MCVSQLFTQILKIFPWLLISYRIRCRLLCMTFRDPLSLESAYYIRLASYCLLLIPLLFTRIQLPLLSEYSRVFLAVITLHMLLLLSDMPFPLSDRRTTVYFSRCNSKRCSPPLLPQAKNPLSTVCSHCSNWTPKENKIWQCSKEMKSLGLILLSLRFFFFFNL